MRKSEFLRAIGLHYEESDSLAPRVGVKAAAMTAEKVVSIAKRFGVPVVEDSALARSLDAVELDSEIPEELFEAVAVVLARLEEHEK